MATKVKADCPKQDPVFADNDNRDVVLAKNENLGLPTVTKRYYLIYYLLITLTNYCPNY